MALPSNFSTRPYAVGSLIGCRAFMLDYTHVAGPVIRGPRFPQKFKSGVTEARCITPDMSMSILTLGIDSLWDQMPLACVTRDCTCGFYAYTNLSGREFEAPQRMNGIIEGFGQCVVGPEGFRCSKARVLALVMPHLRGEDDPHRELWSEAGSAISLRMGQRAADKYRVPLFETYAEAVEEYPLSEYEYDPI